MSAVTIRPARPGDNAGLLALMRRAPVVTPSESYSMEREPDAFALSPLQGAGSLLLVACDAQAAILGLICISRDRVWLDGEAREILYTSELRVAPEARGQGLGDRLMRAAAAYALDQGHEIPHFNCVATGNPVGLRMNRYLSEAGLSPMSVVGEILTAFWPCRLAPLWPLRHNMQYRLAEASDRAEMAALWDEIAPRRQLARAYTEGEWGHSSRFPQAQAWVLAHAGNRLMGFVGIWDQRALRQIRMQNPGPVMRLISGNGPLALAHCLHLCLRPEARPWLPGLLRQALQQAQALGAQLLSLALDAQDPLTAWLPQRLGSLGRMHLLASLSPHKSLPYHLEMSLG